MKLKYINEIADTCCEFMEQVLCMQESATYDTLMKRAREVVNYIDWTELDNGYMITFYYKRMTFYVRKDPVLGRWHLDSVATFNHRDVSDQIELED